MRHVSCTNTVRLRNRTRPEPVPQKLPAAKLSSHMPFSCTISCPACRQSMQVWITGAVNCPGCGSPFEVGVYSPPAESLQPEIPTSSDFFISGGLVKSDRRVFHLEDLVGTTVSRKTPTGRAGTTVLLIALAPIAAWNGQTLLALGLMLLAVRAGRWWWDGRNNYVVSWITRQGREGRRRVYSHSEATSLLERIRQEIETHSRASSSETRHSRPAARAAEPLVGTAS